MKKIFGKLDQIIISSKVVNNVVKPKSKRQSDMPRRHTTTNLLEGDQLTNKENKKIAMRARTMSRTKRVVSDEWTQENNETPESETENPSVELEEAPENENGAKKKEKKRKKTRNLSTVSYKSNKRKSIVITTLTVEESNQEVKN